MRFEFFMGTLTPVRYLTTIVIVCAITVGSIVTLTYRGLFSDQVFTYQVLQDYQVKKLAGADQFDTALVGDSSLGNVVDAHYLGELTGTRPVNLALTGMYGFAGAYNMVKRAVRSQPIKSVVVMLTLSTWQKPVSYQGYLYTLSRPSDLTELSVAEMWQVLVAFINSTLSPETIREVILFRFGRAANRLSIENDYIKQVSRLDPDADVAAVTGAVAPDKTKFLAKLIRLCRERNIKLIFLHGPYLKSLQSESNDVVAEINEMLDSQGIAHSSMPIPIAPEDIGDSVEHVHPDFKGLYTRRVAELIEPLLERQPKDQ